MLLVALYMHTTVSKWMMHRLIDAIFSLEHANCNANAPGFCAEGLLFSPFLINLAVMQCYVIMWLVLGNVFLGKLGHTPTSLPSNESELL